jgi:hypothetical protein
VVSTPVRAERRKTPAVTNGGEKPSKKGTSSPALPVAAQTAPAPAAQPAVIEKPVAPPVKKQEKPVGIVAPKVTGDIKLVVSGPVVPSLSITFKEFAASRRSRPLTRAEARREPVAVAPLVSSHDGVHHYVVVQAREGIYTIAAQTKNPSASATFQLKLFEGSAREKNRNIGSIKLDNRVVVVRLLMPDGIVWDDDAAFTGNLEDSDSVTKFNADTGLVWKEYK